MIGATLRKQRSLGTLGSKIGAVRLLNGIRWTSRLTPTASLSSLHSLPRLTLKTTLKCEQSLASVFASTQRRRETHSDANNFPHPLLRPAPSSSFMSLSAAPTSSTSADISKEQIMNSLIAVQALCPKLLTSASIRQYANEIYDNVMRMADFPRNPFVRSRRDKEKQKDDESEGEEKVKNA